MDVSSTLRAGRSSMVVPVMQRKPCRCGGIYVWRPRRACSSAGRWVKVGQSDKCAAPVGSLKRGRPQLLMPQNGAGGHRERHQAARHAGSAPLVGTRRASCMLVHRLKQPVWAPDSQAPQLKGSSIAIHGGYSDGHPVQARRSPSACGQTLPAVDAPALNLPCHEWQRWLHDVIMPKIKQAAASTGQIYTALGPGMHAAAHVHMCSAATHGSSGRSAQRYNSKV